MTKTTNYGSFVTRERKIKKSDCVITCVIQESNAPKYRSVTYNILYNGMACAIGNLSKNQARYYLAH